MDIARFAENTELIVIHQTSVEEAIFVMVSDFAESRALVTHNKPTALLSKKKRRNEEGALFFPRRSEETTHE
ncbi:hypothetical protein CEXT_463521 [Caerostris extrusa]|uniref:Uncharacterized protein n=1 Tax=Caerostris extrusa TaxID=172846 RepID=A0AAV4P8X6_CAEEX|nr:hypothetical protein CEXT_463521 [Caerostris extrusa]